MQAQDYAGAARIARASPGTLIRNQQTIDMFKNLPSTGGPAPMLIYFQGLMETPGAKLNELESVELCRPIL
jgi:hypothetical protein